MCRRKAAMCAGNGGDQGMRWRRPVKSKRQAVTELGQISAGGKATKALHGSRYTTLLSDPHRECLKSEYRARRSELAM